MRYAIATREEFQAVLQLLRQAHALMAKFDSCTETPRDVYESLHLFTFPREPGQWLGFGSTLTVPQTANMLHALAGSLSRYDCEPLDYPVEVLTLSPRLERLLRYSEVYTLRQLTDRTAKELLKLPDFGRRALSEIRYALSEIGCTLSGDDH